MKIKIIKNFEQDVKVYVNEHLIEDNYIQIDGNFNLRITQCRLSSSNINFFKALIAIVLTLLLRGKLSFGNEIASPAYAEWNGKCKAEDLDEGIIKIEVKICEGNSAIVVDTQNVTVVDYTSEEKVSKADKIRWLLIILCFVLPLTALGGYGLSLLFISLFTNDNLDGFSIFMHCFFIVMFFSLLIFVWIKTLTTLKIKSSDKKNINVDVKVAKVEKICYRISFFAIFSSVLTSILLILGPFVFPNGELTYSLFFNVAFNIIFLIILTNIIDKFYNSTKKIIKYLIWTIAMLIVSVVVMLITLSFYK